MTYHPLQHTSNAEIRNDLIIGINIDEFVPKSKLGIFKTRDELAEVLDRADLTDYKEQIIDLVSPVLVQSNEERDFIFDKDENCSVISLLATMVTALALADMTAYQTQYSQSVETSNYSAKLAPLIKTMVEANWNNQAGVARCEGEKARSAGWASITAGVMGIGIGAWSHWSEVSKGVTDAAVKNVTNAGNKAQQAAAEANGALKALKDARTIQARDAAELKLDKAVNSARAERRTIGETNQEYRAANERVEQAERAVSRAGNGTEASATARRELNTAQEARRAVAPRLTAQERDIHDAIEAAERDCAESTQPFSPGQHSWRERELPRESNLKRGLKTAGSNLMDGASKFQKAGTSLQKVMMGIQSAHVMTEGPQKLIGDVNQDYQSAQHKEESGKADAVEKHTNILQGTASQASQRMGSAADQTQSGLFKVCDTLRQAASEMAQAVNAAQRA